jgi:hypothetical protein
MPAGSTGGYERRFFRDRHIGPATRSEVRREALVVGHEAGDAIRGHVIAPATDVRAGLAHMLVEPGAHRRVVVPTEEVAQPRVLRVAVPRDQVLHLDDEDPIRGQAV